MHGIRTKITKASFLDDGSIVGFDQDPLNSKLKIDLPAVSRNGTLRIVVLDLSGNLETDQMNSPDYVPPIIHHTNRIKIIGTIQNLENCEFEISGKVVSTNQTGFEVNQENETNVKLSLNDHVRYRINKNGNIERVLGYHLSEDEKYAVVYSPYPETPVLEIITWLKD